MLSPKKSEQEDKNVSSPLIKQKDVPTKSNGNSTFTYHTLEAGQLSTAVPPSPEELSDEEFKKMVANALQTRTGIDVGRKLAILLAIFSLLCLYFNANFVALLCVVLSVVCGVTWEKITRPPDNNPAAFLKCFRDLSPPRPVLVCVGDSLTHGRISDNWTVKIPPMVAEKMKFDKPKPADFMDPVWVVNNGQNAITSWSILQERLQATLACYPDYVMVMIGTNDVLCMLNPTAARERMKTFNLPEPPSMPGFRRNLAGILDFITKASPKTEIGLCTLPPIGEDVGSPANKLVKEANEIIHSVVHEKQGKCAVLEVGERLQNEIVSKNAGGKKAMSPTMMLPLICLMTPLNFFLGFSWKSMTSLSGGSILHDTIHLNEDGGDVVAQVVVEWLFLKNIHKAIAVKQF